MQVMLITGTSRGIGNELARHYLECGYKVIGCSRSESDIVSENYTHYQIDITDERAVSGILWENDQVDILINNAGIASMNHSLLMPSDVVREVFNTNVLGTFVFCREVAKVMHRRHWGRIINFSSIAVAARLRGEAVYAASKAAVESMSRIMAKEFGEFRVTVNTIAPGPCKIGLVKGVDRDKLDKVIAQQAIQRYTTVGDIADVIDFLISDKAGFITGEVIHLGGGG